MMMLLDECQKPATLKQFENRFADQPIPKSVAQKQYNRFEAQYIRTQQAFRRLDQSESKLKTSATQILLAILRYAGSQDDPAD